MRILVIEDEKKIASFVRKGLEEQGVTVTVSNNGDDGYLLAKTQPFDVIILDIMLPGRDGLSILKNLREQKNIVPVIMLTARSEMNEKVEGLNLGADDYITKPFYMEELIARVQAIARRGGGEKFNILQASDLTVNLVSRDIKRGTRKIELTPREFSLLEYIMRSPGRVFTRTQILEHVWGYDFDPQTNIVDVCVQRVRKKIFDEDNKLIETVRGVGYRFYKK
ncbi:MAG: DNA-binding response regulator [Lentisphaerae bacterium RIFOXYA12_FULL_48_11]|nr:MAG: DNA-binding response regulator [Lentisphaerae bacterium RIFOXYA12_FULL_48_11]